MKGVRARCPTRVDLSGGTIDLWPIHQLLSQPTTVNVAISLWAQTEVTLLPEGYFVLESEDQKVSFRGSFQEVIDQGAGRLPLHALVLKHYLGDKQGVKIATRALSPQGAGIGGSSALAISLMACVSQLRHSLYREGLLHEATLVAMAQDIEAKVIQSPTGCQDYWAAVRGGLNLISYPPGRVDIETLPVSSLKSLSEGMVLCFSGKSRQSAINNWEIYKRFFDRDKLVVDSFQEIAECSKNATRAFISKDGALALEWSAKEWQARKKLWPEIESHETKALLDLALRLGFQFGRVCGAGGGGVVALFCEPLKRNQLVASLQKHDWSPLDFQVTDQGLCVEVL